MNGFSISGIGLVLYVLHRTIFTFFLIALPEDAIHQKEDGAEESVLMECLAVVFSPCPWINCFAVAGLRQVMTAGKSGLARLCFFIGVLPCEFYCLD